MDVPTLQARLARGEPTVVLDIRPEPERREWAIPGSRWVEAYASLRAGDPAPLLGVELPADVPVVTVCGAGRTSQLAAAYLRKRGVQAESLDGGMRSWSLAWNLATQALGADVTVDQVRRTGKGCLSYVLSSGGEAAVIDPSVEPAVYESLAKRRRVTITHVLETHVHADHLSRARLLAEATGAPLLLPAQDRVRFAHTPLSDGDRVHIGPATLRALHAPGHTPESTAYVLDGSAVFTGDTLFLDGVGRPDLGAEDALEHAKALYLSLSRLRALPADPWVFPGHAARAPDFDGQPWSARLVRVLADVPLLHLSRDEFLARVAAARLPPPPNHARIVARNEAGEGPGDDPAELEAGANRCAAG